MNDLERIKEIIKQRSYNEITDKKANDLTSLLRSKYPTMTMEDRFSKIEKFNELPPWLNDGLTINETFFFRHPEQFTFLQEFLEGRLKENKKELKVLCGGVATGEEAYSLSFVLHSMLGNNYTITGIDLSPDAIKTAKAGSYHESLINRCPEEYLHLMEEYMDKGKATDKDKYFVKEDIKNRINFKSANIFNVLLNQYDLIFFRNILIYFSNKDKEIILEKLFKHLNSDGLIFIGAGELFPVGSLGKLAFKTSVKNK